MATTAYQSSYTGAQIDAAVGAVANKADKITEVNHGTSDTTFTLTANTMHIWGTVTSLTLSLPTDSNAVLDEFMFTFTSGTTPTTLSLPSSVKWVQELTVEASKTYQVSIINGLAGWLTDGMSTGGGGGGEANVIESISVNGTPQTVTNKNVDINVPTETTVTNWGFTKNAGTITGITMNSTSKGTSGVVDLGTVITSHQDISGKAEKSEMSVVAGTGTDADKTTITLKSGTSATVLTTHQDISGKADTSALAGYLPLTGGTLTGALTVADDITTTGEITLNNGKYIKAKDSGGTVRSLIEISNADNLVLGYGMATVGQVNVYGTNFMVRTNGVNPSDTALLIDSSHNSEFSGYIKATGDIYMAPSTSTTNTDSKKIYFRTSHLADTTNNVGPYVQAITHSSTYGRKRLSVFQVNAASYTGTYSEVFTILPNGNVGIGTTSPTTALGVTGDVDITGSLSFNGTAVATVYSGSSAPSSGTGSNGDIYIQTS